MHPARLTWMLVASIALAGAVATPVRAVESTRLVPSIVRCTDDGDTRAEVPAERIRRIRPAGSTTPVTVSHNEPSPQRRLPRLAYALHRRPPPAT